MRSIAIKNLKTGASDIIRDIPDDVKTSSIVEYYQKMRGNPGVIWRSCENNIVSGLIAARQLSMEANR